MKILFVADNYPPEVNAAATRVSERANYWVKWGHQVTVLTSCPNFPQGVVYPGYVNNWYRKEVIDGVTVIRVKTFISPNKGFVMRVIDFVSFFFSGILFGSFQSRPDVVIATSPQFFAAILGWFLSIRFMRPFIFELGDIWPASVVAVGAMRKSFVVKIIEKLELFLYRRAGAVMALTRAFRDNLVRRGIPAGKIAVVRNGVELSRYKPLERDIELTTKFQLKDKFVVGFVGTHGMAAALHNVLHAAEKLKDDDSIRILLVGDGSERLSLLEYKREKKLDNVIMQGMVPKSEVQRYWSLCDVALVHLRNVDVFSEVIPSKMFEAMAMGLPVIAAMPPGEAIEIIEKEGIGLGVAPEDPDALVAAMKSLAADKSRLASLSNASIAGAKLHSRRRQAELALQLIELVVAERGSRQANLISEAI